MTDQQVDYSKADEVSEDGLRLFKIMMRLEFALKDNGFCVGRSRQIAEVDWDRYTNEKLDGAFWRNIKDAPDAEVLIQNPPKRQIVDRGGSLQWEAVGAVSSVQDLIGAVRRVRNNLFHGGKSGDPDADRNAKLYTAALYVVDQILQDDDVLRTSFTGQY